MANNFDSHNTYDDHFVGTSEDHDDNEEDDLEGDGEEDDGSEELNYPVLPFLPPLLPPVLLNDNGSILKFSSGKDELCNDERQNVDVDDGQNAEESIAEIMKRNMLGVEEMEELSVIKGMSDEDDDGVKELGADLEINTEGLVMKENKKPRKRRRVMDAISKSTYELYQQILEPLKNSEDSRTTSDIQTSGICHEYKQKVNSNHKMIKEEPGLSLDEDELKGYAYIKTSNLESGRDDTNSSQYSLSKRKVDEEPLRLTLFNVKKDPEMFKPLFNKPSESLYQLYLHREEAVSSREKAALVHEEYRLRFVDAKNLYEKAQQDYYKEKDRVVSLTECCRKAELEEPCRWNEMYKRLENYHKEHGSISNIHMRDVDRSLYTWCSTQRAQYRDRILQSRAPHRVEALRKLGFIFQQKQQQWLECYELLVEWKKEFGHCNVPIPKDKAWEQAEMKKYLKLRRWVRTQRHNYKNFSNGNGEPSGYINNETVKMLDDVGFLWELITPEERWHEHYQSLLNYKDIHGHCLVPRPHRANKDFEHFELSNWVGNQRTMYNYMKQGKKNSLDPEKVKLLEDAGFVWKVLPGMTPVKKKPKCENKWQERYEELLRYKDIHGNTMVTKPKNMFKGDKWFELANWVSTQRAHYNNTLKGKAKMSPERIKLLEEAGFAWSCGKKAHGGKAKTRGSNIEMWEERFKEFLEFKKKFGSSSVPKSWSTCSNPNLNKWGPLARWMRTQRTNFRYRLIGHQSGLLDDERIKRLGEAGFDWRIENMTNLPEHIREAQIKRLRDGRLEREEAYQESDSSNDEISARDSIDEDIKDYESSDNNFPVSGDSVHLQISRNNVGKDETSKE